MADTPFGLSFGNPRQYMGSSGLQNIVDDYKKVATAQLFEKSGLKDFFNNMTSKGDYQAPSDYTPSGGVMPPTNYGFSSPQGAVVPPEGMSGLGMKGTAQQGLTMPSPVGLSSYQGAQSPYDMAYKANASLTDQSQSDNASSYLNDAMKVFNVSSFTNPTAQHDVAVNPNENYGYTQQLSSGDAYTKMPGYGSLKDAAKMAAGLLIG